MIRTRVGYAGGTTANPTYTRLGDHSETVQIEYDPSRISYRELLEVFWRSHNPVRPAGSRQYMSAIFYHTPEQQRLAMETRDQEAAKRGTIHTEIVPASTFYPAEDYHQKYYLRRSADLMAEFRAMYPDEAGLVASTAAARVNGILGRHGSLETMAAEIPSYGLSPEATQKLLGLLTDRAR